MLYSGDKVNNPRMIAYQLKLHFPEFFSLCGFKLGLTTREIYVQFGRYKWNISRFTPKAATGLEVVKTERYG